MHTIDMELSEAELFKKWKAADLPKEKPATRKGWVTPQQVEEYCIGFICKAKEGVNRSGLLECCMACLH